VKKRSDRQRCRDLGKPGIRVQAREFVFVDRKSGKKRFAVKPDRAGKLPMEETSSLLAMHCVLRSLTPADFRVLVSVGKDFIDRIVPRTKKLIAACSPELMPIQITVRQQQVLRGIFQNLRNKEIAAGMNVAERTVKFHVASLLAKFHVRTRVNLTEKLGDLMSAREFPAGASLPAEFPSGAFRGREANHGIPRPALVRLAAGERRASR
jgi:DNA-binding CsgD family transcriptional regulator